jgi:hypothetical protein
MYVFASSLGWNHAHALDQERSISIWYARPAIKVRPLHSLLPICMAPVREVLLRRMTVPNLMAKQRTVTVWVELQKRWIRSLIELG